jgi:choline dehydrogenase
LGVGQNLQDHLEVHVKHRCRKGLSKNGLLRQHRIILAGMQWFLFKTGPAATTHSRVGGFLRTDDSLDYPNLQYHFWPYFLEGWSPPPEKDGYCFDVGPLRPESRGWVRIGSSDPLTPPRIRLNGLSTDRDKAEFRAGIRMTREIAAQKAFDFCRGPEVSPGPDVTSVQDIDAYVRLNANSAYHPCGTCKMGTDDLAVVDPDLRVRGIARLRIADASVIPTITTGNINAPCMMIGEYAADMILNG